jgi:predicted O-methyltransferase YrrM
MNNKIRKSLYILKSLVQQPRVLLKAADVDFHKRKEILKNYGIDRLPTISFLDLFANTDIELECCSFLPFTSYVQDFALLKGLAMQRPGCEYLEIGSLRGESIVNVASVAAHCTSVTLSKEEMRAMKFPEKIVEVHEFFSKDLPNITHIHHNSATFDFGSLNKKFDVIFVDGDHSYEGVKADTAKMYDLLRDDNSVIVWHDYGHSPTAVRHEVLAGILDGTPRELHKHLYHVSNTYCAIFAKGEFATTLVDEYSFPDKVFRVKVSVQPLT